MRALLSYWSEYFTPGADAPLSGHSTGQIAQHLYDLLDARLGCDYVGEQPAGGVDADLFVGHFWAFLDFCDLNHFDRRVAVYPVANPVWTRELLLRLAAELGRTDAVVGHPAPLLRPPRHDDDGRRRPRRRQQLDAEHVPGRGAAQDPPRQLRPRHRAP